MYQLTIPVYPSSDKCRNEHGGQTSNANRWGPRGQAQAAQSRAGKFKSINWRHRVTIASVSRLIRHVGEAGSQANKRTWP
jgi:hypothetical protein